MRSAPSPSASSEAAASCARRAVDAHQHFWPADARPSDPPPLRRDFTPDDLGTELHPDVGHTVLVQCAAGSDENDRLAAYAAAFPAVGAVVAWLPLDDPEAAEAERRRAADAIPLLRGFRTAVAADTVLSSPVRECLEQARRAGLTWELVATSDAHVRLVEAVAASMPDLPVAVDHLATPPLGADLASAEGVRWRERIDRLAALPSVHVKVSLGGDVLKLWQWDPDALPPYIGHALAAFGAERSMLAGNWPVIRMAADHRTAWSALQSAVASTGAGHEETASVGGTTALRFYGIPAMRT